MPLIALLLLAMLCPGRAGAGPTSDDIDQLRARLERLLRENVVPFWRAAEILDEENGGYRLNHGLDGEWLGEADKGLVSQAETLRFFARLYRSGYGQEADLERARHGFEFLRDRMRDRVFGGFFWQMDYSGRIGVKPHKHLYGQAVALGALAEYGEASGDTAAVRLADELFALIDEKGHDAEFGGYREWFRRDWGELPYDHAYMDNPPDGKLMSTHLRLLEAFTIYCRISGKPVVRERVVELMMVLSSAVVRKGEGGCTERYERDWTPVLEEGGDRVVYGRDLENGRRLMEACRVAEVPVSLHLDLYRALMDQAVLRGFDLERGGFYAEGVPGEAADVGSKQWWVQGEGLASALELYRLTGEERYFEVFLGVLQWIEENQADWERGEWYERIAEDGGRRGGKAHLWKSPFASGGALLEALRILPLLPVAEEE